MNNNELQLKIDELWRTLGKSWNLAFELSNEIQDNEQKEKLHAVASAINGLEVLVQDIADEMAEGGED